MSKKTGVFGGSFDPIHFGHINFAIEMKEQAKLDEIIFVPAYITPFKVEMPPVASIEKRLEMVKLAIEDIEGFSLCDFEANQQQVNYTVDTLRYLQATRDQDELHLLITNEALSSLEQWKDYEQIFKIAPPLIGVRKSGFVLDAQNLPDLYADYIQKNLIATDTMDISSTKVRHRLKNKLYCSHLIPGKVLDTIYKYDLYFSVK